MRVGEDEVIGGVVMRGKMKYGKGMMMTMLIQDL